MVEIEEFPIIWKRPYLDLEKLAYFHQVQGCNLNKLAKWAKRSPITIRQILKRMADEKVGKTMKSVVSLIATIILVAMSAPISKNLYQQVRVESFKQVDQGLGSLTNFTVKLTHK